MTESPRGFCGGVPWSHQWRCSSMSLRDPWCEWVFLTHGPCTEPGVTPFSPSVPPLWLLTEPDLKRGSDATIPRANKGPASQPPRASWGLLIHEKALSLVSWLLQFVKTPLRACSCRVKDCEWKYISSKHHARNVVSHLTVQAYELRNNEHTEV